MHDLFFQRATTVCLPCRFRRLWGKPGASKGRRGSLESTISGGSIGKRAKSSIAGSESGSESIPGAATRQAPGQTGNIAGNVSSGRRGELQVRQRIHRGENTVWTVMRLDAQITQKDSWKVSRRVIAHDIDGSGRTTTTSTTTSAAGGVADTGLLGRSPMAVYRSLVGQVRDKLAMGFLPKGYPHSVSRDYTPYTIYSFLHAVTGTLTGTLSTQALLHALGMGAAAAAGLAATTNWIIKDGFGLLGGVLYAGVTANRFDSNPKRYRFLAAAAIQVATVAELLTPLVPHLFIPMASLSNICKNIGWLAASATRASMHKGFSKEDNLGDVTAKAGAQSTAAGLVGTAGGVALSWAVGTHPATLISVFIPLCAVNMWCAYRANEAVVTRSFNLERSESLFYDRVHALVRNRASKPFATVALPALPNPETVSGQEHFIFKHISPFSTPLALEPLLQRRLHALSTRSAWADFLAGTLMGKGGEKENYRVLISPTVTTVPKKRIMSLFSAGASKRAASPIHVCCWFTPAATPLDLLKGFYHASIVRALCAVHANDELATDEAKRVELVQIAYDLVEDTFDDVVAELTALGWEVGHTHLGDLNARLDVVGA
ncbi:vitamin B6 photo-protection and homoeostasis-domain-containing protein [Phlyctochytrium arcticum]|nr:vitamin B6 photo-protection and homoeostasis-domain-containing protein [Phlyctochytrium arcticum]